MDFDLHVSGPLATAGAPPPPPPTGGFESSPGGSRHSELPGVRADERPLGPPRRAAEGHDLRERLRGPLAILLAALAVATLDFVFHKVTGSQLAFGPVRPFWIAAPLALFGVGFTLWRLMEDRTDD
jgi:hypothetical protein